MYTTARGRIIILRCCRDWPCHESHAYGFSGKCGLCNKIPQIIDEDYVIPTSRNSEDRHP